LVARRRSRRVLDAARHHPRADGRETLLDDRPEITAPRARRTSSSRVGIRGSGSMTTDAYPALVIAIAEDGSATSMAKRPSSSVSTGRVASSSRGSQTDTIARRSGRSLLASTTRPRSDTADG
jgi:hypothetical protein